MMILFYKKERNTAAHNWWLSQAVHDSHTPQLHVAYRLYHFILLTIEVDA